MATVAESLGIDWAPQDVERPAYRLTYHALKQAQSKGWSSKDVLLAAEKPLHTYPSGRVPGQVRHVRGEIVAVVDSAERRIVTVYRDVVETELRPDQVDADAMAHFKKLTRKKR